MNKGKCDIYTHTHTHTHTYIYIHTYISDIYTYTYNGILFSLSKEENSDICDITDKHGGHYTKWNKSDIDRYCMLSLICGI